MVTICKVKEKTMLKKLFEKKNLFIRVAIGFALGIIIGILFPNFSLATKVVGDVYLNLLKMLITPIIFCSVFCGIVGIKDKTKLSKLGLRTVALFALLFIACAIITVLICSVVRPGDKVQFDNVPQWDGSVVSPTVTSFLMKIIPSNILLAFVNGDTLSVILFTFIVAIASVLLSDNKNVQVFQKTVFGARDVLYKVFEYFMTVTPIGVLSLIAYSVSYYGAGLFGNLAKYIATCWASCIICFIFVLFLPTVLYTRVNPGKFLKACGKVALVTLSTTSSAATLPTTIKVSTEDLQLPEDITNFIAPLGCTIHMCGGACSFMCLLMFVSQFYSVHLSIGTIIVGILIATLINMAAPGIPGGGIVIGASFLTIMGLPIELIGLYAGIYRLLDMVYTTMNVEGDVAANLIIAKSVKEY